MMIDQAVGEGNMDLPIPAKHPLANIATNTTLIIPYAIEESNELIQVMVEQLNIEDPKL